MKIKLLTNYVLVRRWFTFLKLSQKSIMFPVLLLLMQYSFAQTTVNYNMSSLGLANGAATGTGNYTVVPSIITVSFAQNSSGTAPTYFTSGGVRLYQNATKGGSMRISVATGYKITGVTVTKASGDGDGPAGYLVDGGSEAGTFADGTTSNVIPTSGTMNATSYVEYYNKGNSSTTRCYITAISVTYAATGPAITLGNSSVLSGALTSTYGTASTTVRTVSVSGSALTANITATAANHFEVSSNGTTWGQTATFTQSGGTVSGTLSVRLAATAPVNGSYNNVTAATLTSSSATDALAKTAATGNSVSKKALNITADNQTVAYGSSVSSVTSAGAYTLSGFANGETATTISQLAGGTGTPTYNTTYTTTTNAGTSGITITPVVTTLSATNYSFSPVAGIITIGRANTTSVTIVNGSPYTYIPGTPQGPTAVTVVPSASNGAVSYLYSGTENGGNTYSASAARPTNAGSYSVVATVAQSTNYESQSSPSTPFTIDRAASTITVTGDTSYTYNGSGHGPTTYDHTGSSGAVTFQYTGVGSTSYPESTTRPTAVGTYKAVATLAADNNYASAVSDDFNFQITSVAVPQITSSLTWSMTYGLTAATYTVTASNNPTSFGVSGLPAGLSYNSTTHEITGTPTVAPGDYDVTLTATNEGGTGDEATLVITVVQKEVTISNPVVSDKVYDGSTTAVLTGSANGFVNGDDVTLDLTANFDDANAGQDKPVTSTSTLTGTKASYYTLTQPTGLTADITKATPAVVVTGSDAYTYNGLAQGPATSTVTPSAAGTATYSYSGTEDGGDTYGPSATRPTNAGSYSAIATVAESSNYNTASSTAFAFTIAKADQALTGFGSDIVKLSTDAPFDLPTAVTTTGTQPVTYAVTNTPDADVATISGNTVTITGVGTTGITAHADATANYNAYDANISLTVNFDTSLVPVANAATNVLGTGFVANWNSVLDADSYKLDVYTKETVSTPVNTDITQAFSSYGFANAETFPDGVIANGQLSFTTETNESGTDPAYYTTGPGIRLYGNTSNGNGNTFTLNITGGITVTRIDFERGTGTQAASYAYYVDGATSATGTGSFPNTTGTTTISGLSAVSNVKIQNTSNTTSSAPRLSSIKVYYTYDETSTTQVLIPGAPFNIPAQEPQPSVYTRVFDDLNRDTQYYYVVRAVNGSNETANSNEVAVKTTNAVVWDGSGWSNANVGPDETLDAEIVGAYTSNTNFETKNLTITSTGSLTIQPQQDVVVYGNIILPADNKLVLESDANLVQKSSGADTNPTNYSIIVKRTATMPKMGYTFWGSPVSGQNLYSFSEGYNQSGGNTGDGTPWNRFYIYNESNDYFVSAGLNSQSVFETGRGYAIRGMNKFDVDPANEFLFTGKVNNGILYSQALSNSCDSEQGCEKGYNLLANPYPSNINFDNLYNANSSKIYGTAYFWTNNDLTVTQQAGSNYTGNNYAIYNLSGGTSAVDPDPSIPEDYEGIPNGVLKVGQGFIVKAKVAGKGQSLEFNNDMRIGYDPNAVFYNSKKADKNRFWLTFTSPANISNTILVAYVPEATNGFEIDYDGELFVIGSDAFYSTLGSRKLAIQGKAEFNAEDKVTLGNVYSKDGEYKISIKNREGIFDGSQNIYLKDKLLNKVVNLSQEDYVFQGVKGTDETRFEIVYKEDAVLATDAISKSSFNVYKDGNSYVITSSKKLGKVELYDTAGRLMKTLSTNETTIRIDVSAFSNGVYILKAENSGDVKTKKIIK
ncbi:MAG: T9SS type A sorting domain-containing protein [Chryseobacterium sp.]|nr:T9SS type A sorting domain-containing protein [Chryseobacterium sp.]